jgi:tetratricopeptide (TPR) repeat protein
MGRFEEAIAEVRRAEILDPTSPFVSDSISQILYFARRYEEAIERSRQAIDLNPNPMTVYRWMSRAYEMNGDEQEAFAAYLKRAEADGAGADEVAGMKTAFATGGLKGFWRWQLTRLLEREKSEFVHQIPIARLYARLGQKEEALARLEKAVEDRNHFVIALNVEPLWDSYRTDPRFVASVRRVGLAP